jgi:hypothetical protein
MTVQTNTNVASFNGNGVTQIFPIAFKFNNDTDLVVLLADDATGVSSLLTLNSDYTVSGEGDEEGGLINVVVAPAVGKRLIVSRVVDILQMTDLRNQGKFFAEVHEDAFDLLTMIAQQHQSDIARSLRVAETDPEPARIPPAAQRAGKLLAFDADGNPTTALPVADSSTELRQELAASGGAALVGLGSGTVAGLADATDQALGDALVPVVQPYAGAVTRTQHQKNAEAVSILDFGAVGDGVTDCTAAVQAAIDSGAHRIYVPAGVYLIDPDVGVVLKTGVHLFGAGLNKTIFDLMPKGATAAQLANYEKGAGFKRAFTPEVANPRVNDVLLEDFSVILNHPLTAYTTDAIQIGIDFRHITGSAINRVHAGNIRPVGGPLAAKDASKTYLVQGYGIVVGNISAGNVAYCGGEKNRILNCKVWGAYKNVTIDDAELSGASAAYATEVKSCDIQTGHDLVSQQSQYGAGNVIADNILQDVVKNNDAATDSAVVRIGGYANKVTIDYIEAGSGADRLLFLTSSSKRNVVSMNLASATNSGLITDSGQKNIVQYSQDTGDNPEGFKSGGPIVRLVDNAYESAWASFNGADLATWKGRGISSITRNALGDFSLTFERPFRNADDYCISVSFSTNASANFGTFNVRTYGTNSVRVQFATQVDGTTTAIDPLRAWVRVEQ